MRQLLSSRFAVYLVTIGAAVGLGSIWHSPHLVGQYGDGLFVLALTAGCCSGIAPGQRKLSS
jgi:SNF family Na+-dependent transporter